MLPEVPGDKSLPPCWTDQHGEQGLGQGAGAVLVVVVLENARRGHRNRQSSPSNNATQALETTRTAQRQLSLTNHNVRSLRTSQTKKQKSKKAKEGSVDTAYKKKKVCLQRVLDSVAKRRHASSAKMCVVAVRKSQYMCRVSDARLAL